MRRWLWARTWRKWGSEPYIWQERAFDTERPASPNGGGVPWQIWGTVRKPVCLGNKESETYIFSHCQLQSECYWLLCCAVTIVDCLLQAWEQHLRWVLLLSPYTERTCKLKQLKTVDYPVNKFSLPDPRCTLLATLPKSLALHSLSLLGALDTPGSWHLQRE